MKDNNYYLPNRTYTTNRLEYVKAWNALCEKIEKFFPGFTVAGFDPDFWITNGKGVFFTLPIAAVEVLGSKE